MRATAYLVLEIEEIRSYGASRHRMKISKVRQTQPLNEINVRIELDIPDEIIMPKVEALVKYENELNLDIIPVTFGDDDATTG